MSDLELRQDACTAIAAACHCRKQTGHDGPHECSDVQNCDGAWWGTEPNVTPVRMPRSFGLPYSLSSLLDLGSGWEDQLPHTEEGLLDV